MTTRHRLSLLVALIAASLGAAPVPAQQVRPAPDTVAADTASTRGAPVVIRGDTVLYVPSRFGAFTAPERALAIEARIARLARPSFDSITIVPGETSTELMVGDNIIMTVTDEDAAIAGRPRAELAAEFSAALIVKLKTVGLRATLVAVGLGTLYTLIATAVLAALLTLLGRLFPKIYATLELWRVTRMPTIRIQTLELLSATRLTDFLLWGARMLRIAVVLVLFYFYLPLVLSFFPWTRHLTDSLLSYVTVPLANVFGAFIAYVPNVFFLAVIFFVTRYVLKVIHMLFGALGAGTVKLREFDPEWADPTYKIVRFLVLAFVLVVAFPYLPGAKSDAFKGVSLFLGVLFSLGSSSAIANIVAGVVLTYTRAFNVGDRIKMGDTLGDVVAKTLLVTRVRTPKNVDITIPNAMVLSSHILNYSSMARQQGLILHTTITIGYDVPWNTVHALMIAAAKATPNILATPEPFVNQTSLDDFYVSYELNAYTDDASSMPRTYSALHANIQDKFNEGGVEIMSPHYATLRDGNLVTIPANYLGADYKVPPFRVQQVPGGAE